MPTISDSRSSLDNTVKIFDSFYSVDITVPADSYDVVHGYFLSVCSTKTVAANFTAVLFRIAQETGLNVLDLLTQLKGTSNKVEMNKVICYYLNSFKSKTTQYGVGSVPRPNAPVARNIIQ